MKRTEFWAVRGKNSVSPVPSSQAQGDVDLAVRYWKEVLQDSDDQQLNEDVQEYLSSLSETTG